MSDGITIEIKGMKKALRDINARMGTKQMVRAAGVALKADAEDIMAISVEEAPVRQAPVGGALRASKRVHNPEVTATTATVRLTYGDAAVKYAFLIHENPNAGISGRPGASTVGNWKFLEGPARRAIKGMGRRIATSMRRALRI